MYVSTCMTHSYIHRQCVHYAADNALYQPQSKPVHTLGMLACGRYAFGFLNMLLSTTSICVCVHVSTPRLLLTRGIIWTPYDWLNKFYNFCMAAIVGIDSRYVLRIEVYYGNQPDKSKLMLYVIHYVYFKNQLKQLCICNKMECFNYKGGCDIMYIKVF